MNIKKINLFGILFLGSLLVGSFLFLNSCQSHIDSQYNFDASSTNENSENYNNLDDISISNSTVTINKNSLKSSEMATITVILKDDDNNNINNVKHVSCIHSGGTSTGTIGNAVSRGNGKYESIFGAKNAGTSTKIICSVGSKTLNSQPSIMVLHDDASKIIIETADDGTGAEITTQTLSDGHPLTLYAVARDSNNNFVGLESVTWSESNSLGKFSTTTGTSTIYTPNQGAGFTIITADHATLTNDSTEDITMTWIVSDIGDLTYWIKADSLSLNDGNSVNLWRDNSDNSSNMIQNTATKQPVFHTNIINSQPSLRFDGTDDYMIANDKLLFSNIRGLTIFTVSKFTSSGNRNIFTKYGFDQNAREIKVGNGYSHISPDGLAYTNNNVNLSSTANTFEITKLIWTPGIQHKIYIDDILHNTSIDTVASMTDTDSSLVVGAIGEPAHIIQLWSGEIAEVIVYSKALSLAEQTTVRNYLCNKYDLSGCP